MLANRLGVDTAADQWRQAGVVGGFVETIQPVIGQVADARGEAEAQQMTEGKDVIGKTGGIGVVNVRLTGSYRPQSLPTLSLHFLPIGPVWPPALFVSLKGRHRGQPLTLAGLRSLFRHHRLHSQILRANPHRLRHTFGADMVRNGISLPALQRLMGHTHIRTTMLYVQLAPQDVWHEYVQAVQKRVRLAIPKNL